MSEKNEEAAYKALDHIREHPEEWDQGNYFCGTTACFAGTVLIQAGLADLQGVHVEHDSPLSHSDRARKILGWSEIDAERVFYCSTKDFDVLERAVKEVLNGEVDASVDWSCMHPE